MQYYCDTNFHLPQLYKKVFLLPFYPNRSCQAGINKVEFILRYMCILFFSPIFRI